MLGEGHGVAVPTPRASVFLMCIMGMVLWLHHAFSFNILCGSTVPRVSQTSVPILTFYDDARLTAEETKSREGGNLPRITL